MKQYELYCLLCVRVCVCHPGLFISRAPHKRFQSTRREKSFGASLNFSCQSAHTLPRVSSAVEKQLQVHVCNKLTRENCKIRFSCLLWSHIWWFMTVSDLPLFFYSVCFTIWFVSDVWLWGWSACVHKQVQHLPTVARGCAPTSPCSLQLDMLGLLAACRDIQVNINIRCYVRVWDTISITHIYKSRQYIFTCTVVLVLVIAWGACCSCALWRCPPPTLRYHPCSCGAREQLTPLSSPPSEYFSWGRGAGVECLCLESVWAFYLPPFFLFFFLVVASMFSCTVFFKQWFSGVFHFPAPFSHESI